MNLKGDLRRLVIESLQTSGASIDPNASLENLLIAALTIEERRIIPVPRAVHCAAEFHATVAKLSDVYRALIAKLQRQLIKGEDVNLHVCRGGLPASKDDGLLNDWSIYPLHLGFDPVDQHISEQTEPLAFAHVTQSDVFFLDILDPKQVAEAALVEILIRRFPIVAQAYEIKGIPSISLPPQSAAEETTAIAEVCVTVPIQLDGEYYFGPWGGFVSSGASERAVHRMHATLKQVEWLERVMDDEEAEIRQQIAKISGVIDVGDLSFELACHEGQWLLHEKKTGSVVQFS